MKAVRIIFQTIEDDESVGLEKPYEVLAITLKKARMPILGMEAERFALQFWEVLVGMGKINDIPGKADDI